MNFTKLRRRTDSYPTGSIGADLAKRNYVKYLVERYHRYREADAGFGRTGRLHYATIFKNIQTKFKAPTYYIPLNRFEHLVDYLYSRIDNTILGRRNNASGVRNYKSFDEYNLEQMEAPRA